MGRLDQRFKLLTKGSRADPERHPTLRSTIDWSYELLEPAERQPRDRLSVFAGSCDLAAAEAVLAGGDLDALDVVDVVDVVDVLVAMSTTYLDQLDQLQRAVDALGALPVCALVTTGPALDPEQLDPPDNVTVVRSAPHGQVLAHADVLVTHGGHGTVMKGLVAGAPIVCMPTGRDQPDGAEGCELLGPVVER